VKGQRNWGFGENDLEPGIKDADWGAREMQASSWGLAGE